MLHNCPLLNSPRAPNAPPKRKLAFFRDLRVKYIYLAYLAIFVYTWLWLSPGVFAWDVHVQLMQMIKQKFDDWHPTVFMFVWSMLYPILGMKSMLFVQLFAWFSSFALFTHIIYLRCNIGRRWYYLCLPGLLLFSPYSLLTIGSVVKDTQMFYSLLWVFALLAFVATVETKRIQAQTILILSLLGLAYAVNLRHFGMLICWPFLTLWIVVAEHNGCFAQSWLWAIVKPLLGSNLQFWRFWIVRTVLGLCLGLAMFGIYRYTVDKLILRTEFVRASPQIAMMDIVGTYHYSAGIAALPEQLFTHPKAKAMAVAMLDSEYRRYPLHGDKLDGLGMLKVPNDLYALWGKTIVQHPWAYIRHRLRFTRDLLLFKDYVGAMISNDDFVGELRLRRMLQESFAQEYAWVKFEGVAAGDSTRLRDFDRILDFEVERYYNSGLAAFRYPFRKFVRGLHTFEEKLMFNYYIYTPIVLGLVYLLALIYAFWRGYWLTVFLCIQALWVLGFSCMTISVVTDMRYWCFIYIASSALMLIGFLERYIHRHSTILSIRK